MPAARPLRFGAFFAPFHPVGQSPTLAIEYDLDRVVELDRLGYDEAWFGAGNCLEKQEKWYQALHFFNKAVKLNAQNADYWKAAAHAEFKIGNTISSISAYEEASHLAEIIARGQGISLCVIDGCLTLDGMVPSYALKREAEEAAHTAGFAEVDNRLRVVPGLEELRLTA